MFKDEDLKDLYKYLKDKIESIRKMEEKEEEDIEIKESCEKLMRQIEVIRYNPLVFKSILSKYKIDSGILEAPLKQLPLLISNKDPMSKVLIKWRFSKPK